jgi:hypothetical protein
MDKFTPNERRRFYNELGRIRGHLPYDIAVLPDANLYWKSGMIDKGRLARFYWFGLKVCVAEELRGHDHLLDDDELLYTTPDLIHELTHMDIYLKNPVLFWLTNFLPFIQHKFMGVHANEKMANKLCGLEGLSYGV